MKREVEVIVWNENDLDIAECVARTIGTWAEQAWENLKLYLNDSLHTDRAGLVVYVSNEPLSEHEIDTLDAYWPSAGIYTVEVDKVTCKEKWERR